MTTKTKKPAGEKLTTAELIKKAAGKSLPSGEGQGGVLDSSKGQGGVLCPNPLNLFCENILDSKNAPRRSALRGSSLIKDGTHKGNHYEVFAGIDHQFTNKGQIIKPVIVLAIRDQAYLLNLDLLLDLATQLLPKKTWGGNAVPSSESLPTGEGQGGVSSLDSESPQSPQSPIFKDSEEYKKIIAKGKI